MEVPDEVKLADLREVSVQNLTKQVNGLQARQLVLCTHQREASAIQRRTVVLLSKLTCHRGVPRACRVYTHREEKARIPAVDDLVRTELRTEVSAARSALGFRSALQRRQRRAPRLRTSRKLVNFGSRFTTRRCTSDSSLRFSLSSSGT